MIIHKTDGTFNKENFVDYNKIIGFKNWRIREFHKKKLVIEGLFYNVKIKESDCHMFSDPIVKVIRKSNGDYLIECEDGNYLESMDMMNSIFEYKTKEYLKKIENKDYDGEKEEQEIEFENELEEKSLEEKIEEVYFKLKNKEALLILCKEGRTQFHYKDSNGEMAKVEDFRISVVEESWFEIKKDGEEKRDLMFGYHKEKLRENILEITEWHETIDKVILYFIDTCDITLDGEKIKARYFYEITPSNTGFKSVQVNE